MRNAHSICGESNNKTQQTAYNQGYKGGYGFGEDSDNVKENDQPGILLYSEKILLVITVV
ncbi:hypothetical protein [Pedobacter frigoris]|uniref:hypothetical protein n=1 Tax=Pedobacter frigoris TaxID=2571272 RepID=UPI001CED9C79|nr:hypothetical protein [Pedobacter frigoris]